MFDIESVCSKSIPELEFNSYCLEYIIDEQTRLVFLTFDWFFVLQSYF